MSKEKNGPVATIRDGALKSSIWRNDSEKGTYHSATISRVYKDERSGEYRESNSFGKNDLLRVAELSRKSYGKIMDLNRDVARKDQNRDRSNPGRDHDRRR